LFATQIAAKDCSWYKIKKAELKTPIKQFRTLNNTEEKINFFRSKINEFSISNFTHVIGSCGFIKQNYDIEAIYKMYQLIKNFKGQDLNVNGIYSFYEFILAYIVKLSTGPYWGNNKGEEIVNEIKAISKIDACYQQGIDELKRIEHWENLGICDTILQLEIRKSKLILRLENFFNKENGFLLEEMSRFNMSKEIAIDRLIEIKENYSKIKCYNEMYNNDIINLIDSLKKSY
jgi:hypothetical protein